MCVYSGGSRILKGGGGGGVSLSRTFFSTALVRAHEAGDACKQNDKKGGSAEPKEPPWIRHWYNILTAGIVIVKLMGPDSDEWDRRKCPY